MIRLLGAIALGLALGMAGPGVSSAAELSKFGIGAYGGTNTPIVQDDAGNGALFGIRGRIGLVSMLQFEPSVSFLKNGDGEVDIEGTTTTFEAPKVTSVAFNLLLKRGFMYSTAGIGWSSVDVPDGAGESSETTYNFGGGVEIGFGALAVDISPRLFVITTADSASRKNLVIMIGANYYLF